jgi:hypothetical protein
VADERREARVVGAVDDPDLGRERLEGRAPDPDDPVGLAEPVELVAEEVRQDELGRADLRDEGREGRLVDLEDAVGARPTEAVPVEPGAGDERRRDRLAEVRARRVRDDDLARPPEDRRERPRRRRLPVRAGDQGDRPEVGGEAAGDPGRQTLGDETRQRRPGEPCRTGEPAGCPRADDGEGIAAAGGRRRGSAFRAAVQRVPRRSCRGRLDEL